MLIGAGSTGCCRTARKSWGDQPKKFIQIDIEPKEMDSNVEMWLRGRQSLLRLGAA